MATKTKQIKQKRYNGKGCIREQNDGRWVAIIQIWDMNPITIWHIYRERDGKFPFVPTDIGKESIAQKYFKASFIE